MYVHTQNTEHHKRTLEGFKLLNTFLSEYREINVLMETITNVINMQ